MPAASVIMPAYNHESFIGESIESVLNQTYNEIEFLILNDGSTDGTKNVIEKYAAKDSRIRFINKPNNEGTEAALNDLIAEASGEYIMWLSSDDLFFPYTVEKLLNRAYSARQCGLIFGGRVTIDEYGNILETDVLTKVVTKETKNDVKDGYKYYYHKCELRKNIVSGCSTAVKKDSYIKSGGFDARFKHAHDYHTWLKIFANTDVSYIAEPLSKTRVHPGQITSLGRNELDAVRACFDIYKNRLIMRRYLDRIGIEYSEETLVLLIKQLSSLLTGRKNSAEKNEFVYQLNKYIKSCGFSGESINALQRERALIELITDESAVSRVKITREEIEGAFRSLSARTGLDGILINPEAVRYHLIDQNDAQSFYKKVMPHDNMLCTAEISAEDLTVLKDKLIFYTEQDDKKDIYKIGITSYMAENAPYRDKFRGIETLMHITLNGELYRIIVEES